MSEKRTLSQRKVIFQQAIFQRPCYSPGKWDFQSTSMKSNIDNPPKKSQFFKPEIPFGKTTYILGVSLLNFGKTHGNLRGPPPRNKALRRPY